MSEIYLNTIAYLKPEIDQKMTDNLDSMTSALLAKVDVSALGSPSGVSTLNPDGQVNEEQLPPGYTGTIALGNGTSLVVTNGLITDLI